MTRGVSSIPSNEFYVCQTESGNAVELRFGKLQYSTGYHQTETKPKKDDLRAMLDAADRNSWAQVHPPLLTPAHNFARDIYVTFPNA